MDGSDFPRDYRPEPEIRGAHHPYMMEMQAVNAAIVIVVAVVGVGLVLGGIAWSVVEVAKLALSSASSS